MASVLKFALLLFTFGVEKFTSSQPLKIGDYVGHMYEQNYIEDIKNRIYFPKSETSSESGNNALQRSAQDPNFTTKSSDYERNKEYVKKVCAGLTKSECQTLLIQNIFKVKAGTSTDKNKTSSNNELLLISGTSTEINEISSITGQLPNKETSTEKSNNNNDESLNKGTTNALLVRFNPNCLTDLDCSQNENDDTTDTKNTEDYETTTALDDLDNRHSAQVVACLLGK